MRLSVKYRPTQTDYWVVVWCIAPFNLQWYFLFHLFLWDFQHLLLLLIKFSWSSSNILMLYILSGNGTPLCLWYWVWHSIDQLTMILWPNGNEEYLPLDCVPPGLVDCRLSSILILRASDTSFLFSSSRLVDVRTSQSNSQLRSFTSEN